MTATLRTLALLGLVGVLAACAEPAGDGGGAPEPTPALPVELPEEPGALVLQVEHTGGFTTPDELASRLPLVTVFADGRVFSQGPVAAIYPPFAWPNVQVLQVPPEQVQELVGLALDAGVTGTGDLGSPPVADAPSTRFTLVTAGQTFVREVYALAEGDGAPGLTEAQREAREELRGLVDELTTRAQWGNGSPEGYEPEAVAAVVRPWTPPEDHGSGTDVAGPPRPWPGPPLPGELVGPLPDLTCVVATGDQARAVREAATGASTLTPWSSGEAVWSVSFRPLLPHETGCADLTG